MRSVNEDDYSPGVKIVGDFIVFAFQAMILAAILSAFVRIFPSVCGD